MSADGKVTLVWGDGENEFRFAIGQFRELQERVNARRQAIGAPIVGPMSLLNLVKARDAWPDDVRDILRIGLVGAGMSLQEAQRKLVTYFDNRPLIESYRPAYTVLAVGLVGDPNDQPDAKKRRRRRPRPADPVLRALRNRSRNRFHAAPGRRLFVLATARMRGWIPPRKQP